MSKSYLPYLSARHVLVLELREQQQCGFREIGEMIGVMPRQAWAIYRQSVFRRNTAPRCFHSLSCRNVQILQRIGLKSRAAVRAAVASGELGVRSGVCGYGVKSHIEILAWLARTLS